MSKTAHSGIRFGYIASTAFVSVSVSCPPTISNNIVSVSGTGTVQVIAVQTGNGNYNAATSVVRSFTAQ
jgi:hypothetical protein